MAQMPVPEFAGPLLPTGGFVSEDGGKGKVPAGYVRGQADDEAAAAKPGAASSED